jgi:threonine synthase
MNHLERVNVCDCGSPMLVEYDMERVGAAISRDAISVRPSTMWRYRELLPVEDTGRIVSLGEGFTPLLPASVLASDLGMTEVYVKDDGLNPTGTFKARGAASGITAVVERSVAEVALPTAGNAGGAWAAYGAAAGVVVHVAMPVDAPMVNRLECDLYGADVTLVDGSISHAGRVIDEGLRDHRWFDVGTLHEPYRIEGKKTLGFEIAEQLGWRLPDAIVYPAGGGVGIIGIWRALTQLRALGWADGDPPRLIVVQAEGCAPLVKAYREGSVESEPWADARTVAHGLRVPKAFGDFLVLRAVRETGGTAVAVPDDAILSAMARMAGGAGILASPEGAATLAGLHRLRESGDVGPGDRVVLINTGSGLKYTDVLQELGTP